MAYPSDGDPKRWQVLQALKTALSQPPNLPKNYHHIIYRVDIHETQRLVMGSELPALAIVPNDDTRLRNLSCNAEDRLLSVTIYGAIRTPVSGERWKLESNWLIADIRRALADDLQLGATALWFDFEGQDVFDTVDSGVALCAVNLSIVYRIAFDDPAA